MALLGKGIFNKLQILLVIQRRQGMKRRVCRRFITVFIIKLTRWFAWWISFRCVQRGDVGAKASESKTRWPWLTAGNPPAVTPLGSQARDFVPTFPICYDFLFRDNIGVKCHRRWDEGIETAKQVILYVQSVQYQNTNFNWKLHLFPTQCSILTATTRPNLMERSHFFGIPWLYFLFLCRCNQKDPYSPKAKADRNMCKKS